MEGIESAYALRTLFDQKITSAYYDSFKGSFGRVQVEVLTYLYDRKRVRIQELADALNIPKQHASKIIGRLEELELVTKQQDPQDGRSSLFFLTQSGSALMDSHLEQSNRLFTKRLSALTQEEQETMLSAMRITAELLKKL